ncbi:hypothetical protein JTY93_19400 [Pseudomonas hygromyciniae]|uniref:Uncharacterized protein n=1 Tax=Pseudomonas hygromyciniae TaxID=2812000 RepID=A0ABX7JW67_9PSED|nr:hypothetical protein [Pseudomonas hygromyciniae]MBN0979190.1 hypothetical protein [Pseudomonas hygromyciniae]QSB38418.1 hypothetical protein JTY93_19400 [Pseudomonas hygromyciniae]
MKMHHRTGVYAAYKIIKSAQIWSKDGFGQANFHTEIYGGGNDCKNEITLHFEWDGEIEERSVNIWPGERDVLYICPWYGNPERLWSLVLFQGTSKHLTLTGCSNFEPTEEDIEHKKYVKFLIDEMTRQRISFSVPFPASRASVAIPQMRKKTFWSRFLWWQA